MNCNNSRNKILLIKAHIHVQNILYSAEDISNEKYEKGYVTCYKKCSMMHRLRQEGHQIRRPSPSETGKIVVEKCYFRMVFPNLMVIPYVTSEFPNF